MLFADLFLSLALMQEARINKLVADLSADQFVRRERATAQLRKMGVLAYPQLVKAWRSRDPEAQRRAEKLLEPIRLKAFSKAPERQAVILHDKAEHRRFLGTVIDADGTRARVLTSGTAACKHGTIEMDGRRYFARLEKYDDDLDLALFSIPYRNKIPPIPLALCCTKGCCWNNHVDLNLPFRKYMEFEGIEEKDWGMGIFTLDESSPRLMLAGVYGALYLGYGEGIWYAHRYWLHNIRRRGILFKLFPPSSELPFYHLVLDARVIREFLSAPNKTKDGRSK